MVKTLSISLLTAALLLSGCGGKSPKAEKTPTTSEISVADVKESLLKHELYEIDATDQDEVLSHLKDKSLETIPLGYGDYQFVVYTDDDYNPIFISTQVHPEYREKFKKVFIYENGMSSVDTGNLAFLQGKKPITCGLYMNRNSLCDTDHLETPALNLVTDVLKNSIMAVSSAGISVAAGGYHQSVVYDFDEFKGDIEDSPIPNLYLRLKNASDFSQINRELAISNMKHIIDEIEDHEDAVVIKKDSDIHEILDKFYPSALLKKIGVSETDPIQQIQAITQALTDAYMAPEVPIDISTLIPPDISKPRIPPEKKLTKSEFETQEEFKRRVEDEATERQNLLAILENGYTEAVNHRNDFIKSLQKHYESDIERIKKLQAERKEEVAGKILRFKQLATYITIRDMSITEPAYNAEERKMYAELSNASNTYTKKIAITADPEGARVLKQNYRLADPELRFSFKDDKFSLEGVQIDLEGDEYAAAVTDTTYQHEPLVIALKDQAIDYSKAKQAELELQNPDFAQASYQVSAVIEKESHFARGRNFQDDIEKEIKELDQAKIDRTKWLFVVAIEDYPGSDSDVMYSERSAKLFTQLMQKKYGVSEQQSFMLIDQEATAGSIKDKLKLLAANVEEGHTIYFYYSGHGVPIGEGDAYILPRDKDVNFLSEDKELKIDSIYNTLSKSPAKRVVAFMDSCFSGKKADKNELLFKGVAPGLLRSKNANIDATKMSVITAGTNNQFSNVFEDKGHRMLSYYLMKGMLDGKDDIGKLYSYVNKSVASETKKIGLSYLQEPQISGMKKGDI